MTVERGSRKGIKKKEGWAQLFSIIDKVLPPPPTTHLLKDGDKKLDEREFCEYFCFSRHSGMIKEKPKDVGRVVKS
jgi:hypothetical protein